MKKAYWALESKEGELICDLDGTPFLYTFKKDAVVGLCDSERPVRVRIEKVGDDKGTLAPAEFIVASPELIKERR